TRTKRDHVKDLAGRHLPHPRRRVGRRVGDLRDERPVAVPLLAVAVGAERLEERPALGGFAIVDPGHRALKLAPGALGIVARAAEMKRQMPACNRSGTGRWSVS